MARSHLVAASSSKSSPSSPRTVTQIATGDLRLELTRRPAGVAEREQRPLLSPAVSDGIEDRGIPGQRDPVTDDAARGDGPVRGVKDQRDSRLHGTAEMDSDRAGDSRGVPSQPAEELGEGNVAHRPVHHEAHGAVAVMAKHVDDRALKARVPESFRGHQEASGQAATIFHLGVLRVAVAGGGRRHRESDGENDQRGGHPFSSSSHARGRAGHRGDMVAEGLGCLDHESTDVPWWPPAARRPGGQTASWEGPRCPG